MAHHDELYNFWHTGYHFNNGMDSLLYLIQKWKNKVPESILLFTKIIWFSLLILAILYHTQLDSAEFVYWDE
jgi:hypothetical protein